MGLLLDFLAEYPEYQGLLSGIENGKRSISVYGMSPIHQAHFIAALRNSLKRPVLVVAKDEQASEDLMSDYSSFSGEQGLFLPCRDLIFHNIDNASREHEHRRLLALSTFQRGLSGALFSSPDALMLHTIPPDILISSTLTLSAGEDYNLDNICSSLVTWGYSRTENVEGPGQFAVRGGILDIFPSGENHPVRAEFWGDTVDSLGHFDPLTQRRTENISSFDIIPSREVLPCLADGGIDGLCQTLTKISKLKASSSKLKSILYEDIEKLQSGLSFASSDRYLPHIYKDTPCAMDYIPQDALIIFAESPAALENAKAFEYRMGEDVSHLLEEGVLSPSKNGYCLSFQQFKATCMSHMLVSLDQFLSSQGFSPDSIISVDARQLPSYGGSLDTASSDISSYLSLGYNVLALAGGNQRAQSLKRLLEEHDIPCTEVNAMPTEGKVLVTTANLSAGFEYPSLKLAVITEGQLAVKKGIEKKKAKNKKNAITFSDLHPGDFVVHEKHGIGRFVGVERISVDKVWRDYIKIAFAGTDFVFVPATSLDVISKYIGAGEQAEVKLSKLGGTTWVKTKTRAKKAAMDLAEGLLKLYAARRATTGFAFFPDDDWQKGFEERFAFDETEDQLVCSEEIKNDMQKPYPMDRLLCGDVGFGKTEVAFRAVMKCILSGKQAAILVPTTVLARQHYLSACQRFAGYPITIDMMSRYRTPGQQRETLRNLRTDGCDLLIGTHRILQKDIKFKNLGLLVIDEEQRFGVSHKEKIKQMSTSVDVLTLTATPIPRTLNMALSGIRDMSVLEEPPAGRIPVQTYVLEHDEVIIRDAIRKELARGGQVYYLHNRIDDIEDVAAALQKVFPDAAIDTAHGRMGEARMADVMGKAYSGDIDILVCTTIIETGVDIPNVNTLIIEDADHMGLAQLHQIRGRVGRSQRHAYAYLTYRKGKVLTEISQKRLSAIREFAEFGSGFKIAMRDLEIRGAGNVLGPEQSGHMMSVGYDMYLRLLDEATAELKGEPAPMRTDCTADLLVSAGLPQNYVPDASVRIDLYRRISMITSQDEFYDMQDELLDRFGDIPASAQALLDIALLRSKASKNGINEITQKGKTLMIYFSIPNMERVASVCSHPDFKGRILFSAGERPYLTLKLKADESPLDMTVILIDLYIGA
ncbi:MAG: transcription-repair coupling factor [Clostridiaceae bacterium]|nr:transcription-repair coupling factor [Clostridiaceae bacterium]